MCKAVDMYAPELVETVEKERELLCGFVGILSKRTV